MKQANGKKRRYAFGIATEVTVAIVTTLVLFAGIVGLASQYLFQEVLEETAWEMSGDVTAIAVDCIEGDDFDEYLQSGGTSAASVEALGLLQKICDDADFNYLYLMKPDFENDNMTCSLIVRGSNHSDLGTYSVGQVVDMYGDEYREACRKIMDGKSEMECIFNASFENAYVTGMVPVHNSNGDVVGIMCSEASYSLYMALFVAYMVLLGMVALILLVITGSISSWFIRARIVKPVRSISKEADRFAETRTTLEHGMDKLKIRDNELGNLASSVDAMEHEIVDSIESVKKMTTERERINAELDIAAKIQEAALPHVFPPFPDRSEFDLHASMNPAKEIGGDFYDYFMIDDDHLALVIADVSGKGVPAALFMMVSKVMIMNHATMMEEPAQILAAVNDRLAEDNEASMFVTVWLGILEISTGVLRCSNAGHEYPAIRMGDAGFVLWHDVHDTALGLMEDMPYSQYTLQLQKGDTVFLYTDGVPEARNAAGGFYGSERLAQALNGCPDASAESLVHHLKRDVALFVGDAAQFDDLTVLALRYLGPES